MARIWRRFFETDLFVPLGNEVGADREGERATFGCGLKTAFNTLRRPNGQCQRRPEMLTAAICRTS
jgi:hypothetical protein